MDKISVKRRRRFTKLLTQAIELRGMDAQNSEMTVRGLADVSRIKRKVKELGGVSLPLKKAIDVSARNAVEQHQMARDQSVNSSILLQKTMIHRRSFPAGFYRRVLSGFSANWRLERRKIRRFLMNKLGK